MNKNMNFLIFLFLNQLVLLVNANNEYWLSMPLGNYANTCSSLTLDKNLLCGLCEIKYGRGKTSYSCVPFFPNSFIINNGEFLFDNNDNTNNKIYYIISDFIDVNKDIYPAGTYGFTCKNIKLYLDNNMCADCNYDTTLSGTQNKNSCVHFVSYSYVINKRGTLAIDYDKSPTFITNTNTNSNNQMAFPNGIYPQTCKQNYMVGNILFGKCKKTNGDYLDTSIIVSTNSYLINRDGVLFDEPGCLTNPSLPSGGNWQNYACVDISLQIDTLCVKTSVVGFVRQSCLKINCLSTVCFDNNRNILYEC